MKCGDCKHRGEPLTTVGDDTNGWNEVDTGFFHCDRIKHLSRYGFYEGNLYLRTNGYDGKAEEDLSAEKALAQDGSGYFAALLVADDFGCVYFEERR